MHACGCFERESESAVPWVDTAVTTSFSPRRRDPFFLRFQSPDVVCFPNILLLCLRVCLQEEEVSVSCSTVTLAAVSYSVRVLLLSLWCLEVCPEWYDES